MLYEINPFGSLKSNKKWHGAATVNLETNAKSDDLFIN